MLKKAVDWFIFAWLVLLGLAIWAWVQLPYPVATAIAKHTVEALSFVAIAAALLVVTLIAMANPWR